MKNLTKKQKEELVKLYTPKWTKYIPCQPTDKQIAFLLLDNYRDVFYGGAASGGKSQALLMAALQYVDYPKYNALMVCSSFSQLNKPEALMDRADEWLRHTDAKWDGEKYRWNFPSGATLSFGYLDGPRDHHKYDGPAYQGIFIDEIVQIREHQALHLFSRMRRTKDNPVPLRFRCASNPPSREQVARGEWVKRRYIEEGRANGRIFIQATIDDNPHMDKDSYIENLNELDPIRRKQLLDGDWHIKATGNLFNAEWFPFVDLPPAEVVLRIRFWDLASTEPSKTSKDPDYTVGLLMSKDKNGFLYVEDVRRFRLSPAYVRMKMKHFAVMDGVAVPIRMEQEGGSSGKLIVDEYRKHLMGWNFKGVLASGSKFTRAQPVSSYAESGRIKVVKGSWNSAFFDELEVFPDAEHDDQVDALSGAFDYLAGASRREPSARWV